MNDPSTARLLFVHQQQMKVLKVLKVFIGALPAHGLVGQLSHSVELLLHLPAICV